MRLRIPNRRLAFILAPASLLGLVLAPLPALAVHACYSDPIVMLSNGQQVDLSATIADNLGDVQSVSYNLMLPAGVSPIRVVYTGGEFAHKEFVTYSNVSSTALQYTSITVVRTWGAGIGVTAHASVTGSLGQDAGSVTAQNGLQIILTVAQ